MPQARKIQKAPPFIGVSQNVERIRELINHVADTGLNILICGESGVGKEVVAQNLYQKKLPRYYRIKRFGRFENF